MTRFLRGSVGCLALTLALGTDAAAQSEALIVGNSRYSMLDVFGGGADVMDATAPLEAQGFDVVQLGEGTATQMRQALGRFVAGLDDGTERVAVILAGRFAHSATDSYLLPVELASPLDEAAVMGDALSLSSVMGLLAAYPGQSLLMLGESDSDVLDSRFLSGGLGAFEVPQGVTVIRGDGSDLGRFARRELVKPGAEVLGAAREAGLIVNGYAPGGYVFVPVAERETSAPAPQAPTQVVDGTGDERLWETTRARDDVSGYRTYLQAFPNGAHAAEARDLVAAIESEPFRSERLAEEALSLNREARREIQRDLSLLDYNTRGIDGLFGPGTRGAVKAWQASNGFDQSGYLEREQITRLDAQAERRAAELEQEAKARQAELERLDRAYWDETGSRGDAPGLRAYLGRYPDGVFAEVAQERLEVFEEEQRAQAAGRDREAWDQARQGGSVGDFQAYLTAFPQGAFAGQAQAEIDALQQPSQEQELIARGEAAEAALNLNNAARRIAEDRLKALGLKPGNVDGEFDDKTRRAIRRYQEARQLQVTGYLDQSTVVRLLADSLLR
ncbi:peptidoglycan-binding protein [Puniceibacterium sp. IMCC21224]|uniref:peptidoglycan-binding protein n=1 Tax=Puniceibacterium sp. IMCC21224 TaxID=1618204 RepID=UPI00065D2C39|nr:peptidoglycan-binding protein [Puniceibacterium sp. IMCC21224]KMK68696.1 putative peptidoglycan binding protein [Puniceibacterium sp. IMCC21224]